MLHNTICDHIDEKRLTLLSTHNAAQCIKIRAESTREFHNPIERIIVTSTRSGISLLHY